MTGEAPLNIHATCVAVDGIGVLLRGAPGAGKSDLALRLIDGGARLVADDRTELSRRGDRIIAAAPAAIAGRIEARGIGIVAVPSIAEAVVRLVVDLVPPERIERLPEPRAVDLLGIALPGLNIDPFAASAPAKLRLAVRALAQAAAKR